MTTRINSATFSCNTWTQINTLNLTKWLLGTLSCNSMWITGGMICPRQRHSFRCIFQACKTWLAHISAVLIWLHLWITHLRSFTAPLNRSTWMLTSQTTRQRLVPRSAIRATSNSKCRFSVSSFRPGKMTAPFKQPAHDLSPAIISPLMQNFTSIPLPTTTKLPR